MDNDPLKQPLDASHYDALQEASRQYHDLLGEFDKADSCGIVCQQMRDSARAHKHRIDKMLMAYFPHGRPTQT